MDTSSATNRLAESDYPNADPDSTPDPLSSSPDAGSGGDTIETFLHSVYDDENNDGHPAESHQIEYPTHSPSAHHRSAADHVHDPHDDDGSATAGSSVYESGTFNALHLAAAGEDYAELNFPRQYDVAQIGRGGLTGWMRASSAPVSDSGSSAGWSSRASSARTASTLPAGMSGGRHRRGRRRGPSSKLTRSRRRSRPDRPHVRDWNISTLPIWKVPSSPTNRLFSSLAESRPGREPRELEERLDSPPPLASRKPDSARQPRRRNVPEWNPSTLLSPLSYEDGAESSDGSESSLSLEYNPSRTIQRYGGRGVAAPKKVRFE